MKFFLPPLIRRTVRARFLGNFVLLFGLLFLLATSIDTLLTFHEYLEVTSGEGIQRFIQAFGFVIDFQLPRLFQLYALLWSPAVVGAAGFTFVRMQRHREIVGLQAAGISRRSLMRPIVEGTLILIVLQGLNQEFMVPKLSPLLARTHGDIGQDAIRAFAVPPTPDGSGRLWCSGSCDPVRGSMADVLVLERDE
ncbi:MAG: LptF/LptG family permease, partial [Phycisphaerales bacterium]|nr:LptF/LptG family permease [Phycisphaerales bacterium]